MNVTIVEYSPTWPRLFEQEKHLIENALGEEKAVIEHVGSTSVAGLAAKSIIDIMVGLHDFSVADFLVPNIEALGYEYISRYEDVMPYRRFFRKRFEQIPTHTIHMVAVGTEFWERHLLFRNFLRNNPATASEYAALKKELATREWSDMNEYAEAKTPFIRNIEGKARGDK